MKKILFCSACSFLILFFILPQNSYSQDDFRRYNLKSGIVEYSVTGTKKGGETLYFDQWGMREARYSTTTNDGFRLSHLLKLSEREWVTFVDLDKLVANKRQDKVLLNIFKNSDPGDPSSLTEQILKATGAQKTGSEVIVERECDIWVNNAAGMKIWIYKGVPLKIVYNQNGVTIITEAIKIQEDVKVPEQKFEIPDNVQFMEEDTRTILLTKK